MIVFPRNWQMMDTDTLGVVFHGELPADREVICLMWPEGDYHGIPDWRARQVLATADYHQHRDGLHVFFFRDLKHHGTCVASIIVLSDPDICHDIGVRLYPSRVSTVAVHDHRLTTRLFEQIRFPLADVWTEHSNYQHDPLHYTGHVEMVGLDRLTDRFREAPEAPGVIRVAVCHPSEAHDASGVLLTEYCHGLGLLAEHFPTWSVGQTYYALLQDVTACLWSGHVVFEDRYRWGDACPSPDYVDPGTTWLPGAFHAGGQRGIVDMRRWAFRGTGAIPMLVANAGKNNYGHWLQNSVMAMFFVRDAIIAGKILPVSPPLSDRQMRPLELIGITRDMILETNEPAVYFPKAIYPSFISTHITSYPGKWGLDCYNIIRERAWRGFGGAPPEYIYFTRKGYSGGHKRGIENEDELIDALRAIGFDIIAPHENTFDQNLHLISRAKIVVSQIGAAMVDIAFAPRGCVVIELLCDCYFNNVHLFLTHLFEQKLIRIVSPVIPGTVDTPEGFRFHVPVDKVRRAALGVMGR